MPSFEIILFLQIVQSQTPGFHQLAFHLLNPKLLSFQKL